MRCRTLHSFVNVEQPAQVQPLRYCKFALRTNPHAHLTMTFTIPAAAATGFRDGSKYDQARPSYPSEAVDSLLKHMQVDGLKGARIVDLGAGTGIFTKLLADRDEGFEIFAVEPHADMRAELEKKRLKGVKVVDGGASKMESVESQYVDAVVAAQVCLLF